MFIQTIDPVAFWVADWPVRWYGLGYILSFILAKFCWKHIKSSIPPHHIDNIMSYGVLAVIIGGRLGHVLFFELQDYITHPIEIVKVWQGGMSFHGGFLGVIIFIFFYAKKYGLSPWVILDDLCVITPIGLGIGRICNFINTELYGSITTLPWGVIFPRIDLEPRHPVCLYEALLEGPILGAIIYFVGYKRFGSVLRLRSGVFVFCYALFRLSVEHLKVPKSDFAPYALCALMMVVGCVIFFKTNLKPGKRMEK